jgi:hypothetical protein
MLMTMVQCCFIEKLRVINYFSLFIDKFFSEQFQNITGESMLRDEDENKEKHRIEYRG